MRLQNKKSVYDRTVSQQYPFKYRDRFCPFAEGHEHYNALEKILTISEACVLESGSKRPFRILKRLVFGVYQKDLDISLCGNIKVFFNNFPGIELR